MGPRITSIIANQLNFPQANIYADPRNPIPAFQAVWFTEDFRPRSVELQTNTRRFDVYASRNSPTSQSRMSVHLEGFGGILVTPAPPVAAMLAAAGAMAIRRRRNAA